jgi:hypothetical protein
MISKLGSLRLISFGWPVTENKILNNKCKTKFLVVISIQNKKRKAWPLPFLIWNDNKKVRLRFGICLFVCNRGDTIHYHGGLWSRELGQAPMLLVFLTPRQALSFHPRQQMVWLYWLQDRDSMPNCYTINHPTTLHTHNETKRPTAARRWQFVLRDVSHTT